MQPTPTLGERLKSSRYTKESQPTLRKANRKRKHEKFIYTSWTCPAGFLLCDTGHILQAQGLQRGSTGNEAWILWSQRRASTSYSFLLSLAFSLASSCVHVTVREPEIRLKSEKRVKLSPCGVGHQIRAWNEEKKKSILRERNPWGGVESHLEKGSSLLLLWDYFLLICVVSSSSAAMWHLSHMMESLNIILLLRVGLKLLTKKTTHGMSDKRS